MAIISELFQPVVWLGWQTCFGKAELSFLQRNTAFRCSFKRVPNLRLVCPLCACSLSLQGME